jgi:outer membrane protein assembly factor BamD (BamD/ComL family)
LLEEVKKADATERPRLADEGVKRIREAANEWRQAAALKTTSLEKGDALCRAADLFLKADDKEESLKTFDLLGLHVPDYPDERLAEVWLKKGDIYLSLGNREQARICFQNGIQIAEKSRSPILLKLRMRLTEILLRSSDPKIAARAIDDLMILLDDPELVKDQELHETALLFIANAVYQQKDYRRAEVRFRSLIDRYPESPRTISARYYLGQCYWFIAGQEADKCNSSKKVSDDPATTDDRRQEAEAAYKISYSQYQEFLNKALEPIKAAETQLLQMLANAKLSAADAELLRKSSLAAADICFFTGKYEEAASRYDAISKRYAQTVVQLEALRSKLRCLRIYLNKPTEASEILTQMSLILQKVPESEFDGSTPVHFREYWLKWLEEQRQMKM